MKHKEQVIMLSTEKKSCEKTSYTFFSSPSPIENLNSDNPIKPPPQERYYSNYIVPDLRTSSSIDNRNVTNELISYENSKSGELLRKPIYKGTPFDKKTAEEDKIVNSYLTF